MAITYQATVWGTSSSGSWTNNSPDTYRDSGTSWSGFNAGGTSSFDGEMGYKATFPDANTSNSYAKIGFYVGSASTAEPYWYLYFGRKNQWVRFYDTTTGNYWQVAGSYLTTDEYRVEYSETEIKVYQNDVLVLTKGAPDITLPVLSTNYQIGLVIENNNQTMTCYDGEGAPPASTGLLLPPPIAVMRI